ncbi:MAG: hypothetical protein WD851_14845 [Pirellulales bacterium]
MKGAIKFKFNATLPKPVTEFGDEELSLKTHPWGEVVPMNSNGKRSFVAAIPTVPKGDGPTAT